MVQEQQQRQHDPQSRMHATNNIKVLCYGYNIKVAGLTGRTHPGVQATHEMHERLTKLHSKVLHLVHVIYRLQPQGPWLPTPLLL